MKQAALTILIATGVAQSAVGASPIPAELIQQQAELARAADIFEYFGTSVSIDGDTVVFGAEGESNVVGAAYVHIRDGSSWSFQQRLAIAGGLSGDSFGHAVAIHSNTVVVGAFGYEAARGAAYVFVRTGANWTLQQRLTASDRSISDYFGVSVAVHSNIVAVGAYNDDTGRGAVYVFVRSGTNWTQQGKLIASDRVSSDHLGLQVDLDGDTIVAGAPGKDIGGSLAGAAYVFARSGTSWAQQQRLLASDPATGDSFGAAVALSGDVIAVGAPFKDGPTQGSAGRVYVFTRTNAAWTERQRITASDAGASHRFGNAVALDDALVVGSEVTGSFYIFTGSGGNWVERATRTVPGEEVWLGPVATSGHTIVAGFGNPEVISGPVTVFAPAYDDAVAVAGYVRDFLYFPDAAASSGFDENQAAFRYKHLLYGQDAGGVRARFELMSSFYGQPERDWAGLAEGELLKGLSINPNEAGLGNLLLDICYDRTVAETILAKDFVAAAEGTRFVTSNMPNAFIIDLEIPLQRQVLATNRFALQCYFDLLKRQLEVQQAGGTNTRWATRVIGFSSQWTNNGPSDWHAVQALGEPNTYPSHGDLPTAWASRTADGQREWLELGYDSPAPIHSISLYETYNPGAVDKVSVLNPNTGQWQEVWSGVAAPAGNTARVFTVTFPRTSFPVDAVRIDLDSPAVSSWNEIDAVRIAGPGPLVTMTDSNFGYRAFQTLVPGRALAPATYTNGAGANVPVIADPMLFSGYKDVVLLFDLLREYGRTAQTLVRLLVGRGGSGDIPEAKALLTEAQQFLFLQGNLLRNMFPVLPPAGDPSGLAEAVAGWRESLNGLGTLRELITGQANLLGFAPDFLMLIENFQDGQNLVFDSFDSFKAQLSLNSADSPLTHARDRLAEARARYDLYRGYEDQLLDEFEDSTESYDLRLFEIVGARPGQPNYSDNPTNNPGSELDQQYRSIEVARLKIRRNQTEIDNLAEEVQIEITRAAAVSSATIRYGNMQASITRTIGHIKAAQAAANALADALTIEKLTTGLAFGFVLNAAAQAGAEEGIAHLEAQKEELAAQERAEIEGINSTARVKTLLLGMRTLAIDSMEAGLLLQQESARLAALYREKAELESRIAESNTNLASRYFADPIHRLAAQSSMITANLQFADAQRWLFFMGRALEYKWNSPFANFQHPPGGRTWSAASIFKVRNADELVAFYNAMLAFDALINRGKTFRFDWFSVREDFMGLKQTNDLGQLATYADPQTGQPLDALSLFRTNLLRTVRAVQGGQEIVLDFNTVRQIPGGFFFVGPAFDADGNVIEGLEGRFLDKIDYLQIRLPGNHTLGRSQLAGNLTYGGTSFIRNPAVGYFDPLRRDRLVDEMTAYSTRYWFYDFAPSQMRWRFKENLTINAVEMELNPDPRIPPTVTRIEEFKERSVAATGWRLTIPLVQQNIRVLNINELNDVEIYFHHYSAQRQ